MERETKTGPNRLLRMRRMFAEKGGILEEDYNYFTRWGEPSPRSKAPHTEESAAYATPKAAEASPSPLQKGRGLG